MNVTFQNINIQNKLNIYNLQNYEFLPSFFQPKKIVKFVKF